MSLRGAPRRVARAAARVLLLAFAAVVAPSAPAQVDERALKAAYLFNFIQFTQWPGPLEAPFGLCVLNRTPMDDALAALEGKPVQSGQHVTIRHVSIRDSLSGCQALYVDDSQREFVDALLVRLNGSPVLTLTDGDGLADKGIMIEIHRRESRLAFEVNLRPARLANLTFNSRMLKLASYVAGATP